VSRLPLQRAEHSAVCRACSSVANEMGCAYVETTRAQASMACSDSLSQARLGMCVWQTGRATGRRWGCGVRMYPHMRGVLLLMRHRIAQPPTETHRWGEGRGERSGCATGVILACINSMPTRGRQPWGWMGVRRAAPKGRATARGLRRPDVSCWKPLPGSELLRKSHKVLGATQHARRV
jgi:hypothetical protein